MDKTVHFYIDGACKGNPDTGGWGILLCYGMHGKELFGSEAETTNNRMELAAAIEGLKSLRRRCTVEIRIDSQYAKNDMESWAHGWRENGQETAAKRPAKNDGLWKELDSLVRWHGARWTWVKDHAGHPEDERADVLVNQGAAQFLRSACESKWASCSRATSKVV